MLELNKKNRSVLVDWLSALLAGLVFLALGGVTKSLASEVDNPFSFRGYGEVLYSHYDFGPNQRSGSNGSPAASRSIMDLVRFVAEVGYDFDESLRFETEIEFEHGGTGSTMEIEYEEFGEYEMEIEKGGEVALEQLHITKSFSPHLNVRLGHFIVPVGLTSNAHLPFSYFGTVRPEAESALVPTTWHETGVEVFGRFGDFRYRVQLVNGLDSTGFSSKSWIRDGHQGRFEQVKATDLATVARLEFRGIRGVKLGASVYHGETTSNRPKSDMAGISAPLTIFSTDARVVLGGLKLRAMFLFGHLENADEISRKNSHLSVNLGVARTPVAAEARAWAVEVGYNVMPHISDDHSAGLYPFFRYEEFNSMHGVDDGVFADPRFDRTAISVGVNWFLTPTVILKSDYSVRSFGLNRYRDEKTISLALAWVLG